MVHALKLVCIRHSVMRLTLADLKANNKFVSLSKSSYKKKEKLSHLGRNLHTYTYTHIQNRCSYKKRGSVVTSILQFERY